jgi:beta-N-acetylhexosaminidase
MAVTLVRDDAHLLPLRLPEDARVLVLYPRHERLTGAEEDDRYPVGFPLESVRPRHRNVDAAPVSPSPDAAEREALQQRAAHADVILALTMNANLYEQQAELVRSLVRSGRPVAGIAVRNPYDLLAFPELPTYLATYEYTPPALEAALCVIFGEIKPVGRLPVSLPGIYQIGQ